MNNKKNNNKNFPPESAGRRMIKNVPTTSYCQTISQAKKNLFNEIREMETINYIYILDKSQKLLGVISLKDIFKASEQDKIKEIMKKEIVKVRPHTDQERVAILAVKNNLKSIPVVDKDNNFLGIVPSDTILDILYTENLEDILKSAGIQAFEKDLSRSSYFLARIRIPWLVIGLFGGIFASKIVAFFEAPLKSYFVIASFIPLIVYMSDAVAHQSQTLFIKNLILDLKINKFIYFLKELKTVFLIASVLGSLLFLLSVFLLKISLIIGFVLGVSLFLAVQTASIIGILIPWLIYSLKKDPAVGSGPFSTIICDILSLIVYFLTASLMLGLL